MTLPTDTIRHRADGITWQKTALGAWVRQPKTIPAATLCRLKGWGLGTWLTAASWVRPRQVRQVRFDEVSMSMLVDGALRGLGSIKRFPADVRVVEVGLMRGRAA